jgi:molecular chaperone HscB
MSLPNFFQLLQIPQNFEINETVLEQHYRLLQQKAHPDNYIHADSITRAQAQQMAGQINEAYHILKNPLLRAKYLLLLQGIQFDVLENKAPAAFLMQQMQWQEALEEAETSTETEQVLREVQAEKQRLEQQLKQLFAEQSFSNQLIETLQMLKYIEKAFES